MSDLVRDLKNELIERLFAEFNEQLRATGEANFALLQRCPPTYHAELRSLMNVAALAYRALRRDSEAEGEFLESAARG